MPNYEPMELPSTHEHKANELYKWLAAMASETSDPLTYGQVAVLIDHPRWALGKILDIVHEVCINEDEPDLTAFVVLDDTDEPSIGFMGREGVSATEERARAHRYWLNRLRPRGRAQ